jgi:hypothetical protein
VIRKRLARRDTVDLFGTGQLDNIFPELILESYVRLRCQAVFDNEHSLCLWKRHPCTWQLKDNWRTGASQLKYDVTCVGSCIDTEIFYVFISSVELYWFATINRHHNIGCVTFRSPCKTSAFEVKPRRTLCITDHSANIRLLSSG